MSIKLPSRKLFILVPLFMGFMWAGSQFSRTEIPADAAGCNESLGSAEFNSWFKGGMARKDAPVNPANSVALNTSTDCNFYKWSEQMFLYLTSREGAGKELTLNGSDFFDVSPKVADDCNHRHFLAHEAGELRIFDIRREKTGSLDLPFVFEKGTHKALEVLPTILSTNGNPLLAKERGTVEIPNTSAGPQAKSLSGARAYLNPAVNSDHKLIAARMQKMGSIDSSRYVTVYMVGGKSRARSLAGDDYELELGQAVGNGVLLSQQGSLVYYSITVNRAFAYYRSALPAALDPTDSSNYQFPTTAAEFAIINRYAQQKHLPPVSNPEALVMEVKCSWVDASTLPDKEQYVRMKAAVPKFDRRNNKRWIQTGSETLELALVGMHVVGSAKGHPELLWSTFEHRSTAPLATYTYRTTTGKNAKVPMNTRGKWLFCSNGASVKQINELMTLDSKGAIIATAGNVIAATNVLRMFPWGLSGDSALGNAEVISINRQVNKLMPSDDARSNYLLVGNTWTLNGVSPEVAGSQIGTNHLANSTMETYHQFISMNCFTCHNTNKVFVSHIFENTRPLQ